MSRSSAGAAAQAIALVFTTFAFVVIANAQTAGDGALPGSEGHVSLARVVDLSQKAVVQTIVKGNVAFALGSIDGEPDTVELLRDVTRAYGVHFGQLLFSRTRPTSTTAEGLPLDTKPGDDLFILDLSTKLVRTVFVEYGVGAVGWHPWLNLIAATVKRDSGNGVLLYDFDRGSTTHIRAISVLPHFLKWSDSGETLYFLEGSGEAAGAATLVEYDLSTSYERVLKSIHSEQVLNLAKGTLEPAQINTTRSFLEAGQQHAAASTASSPCLNRPFSERTR